MNDPCEEGQQLLSDLEEDDWEICVTCGYELEPQDHAPCLCPRCGAHICDRPVIEEGEVGGEDESNS